MSVAVARRQSPFGPDWASLKCTPEHTVRSCPASPLWRTGKHAHTPKPRFGRIDRIALGRVGPTRAKRLPLRGDRCGTVAREEVRQLGSNPIFPNFATIVLVENNEQMMTVSSTGSIEQSSQLRDDLNDARSGNGCYVTDNELARRCRFN